MSLRVGASFGPYDVLPLEGRGGMAEVYRAHDTRLNRDVVLKVLREPHTLDERSAARLRREAHLLASLNHPNIAAIYGLEEHEGMQALVLEFVEGPTLADRIAQGPLPVDQALNVARQIASALEAAHDHGIVHRDVKPSNVKLRPDGTVKVLDFGLATLVRSGLEPADQAASTLTALPDTLAGTTPYMSPEQAQGHAVDRRTDIWAFGCVLFEMLTGDRPFERANPAQTIAAILSQEPRWDLLPPTVPDWCRAVVERCLQKTPTDRLRDMGDVRLALDGAFLPGVRETVAAQQETGPPSPASRAVPWIAAAVVAGVVITGLGPTMSAPADSLTFEVHAPEGARFGRFTMEPYPALSPDGGRLAFAALRGDQKSIWVQEVGELEAEPLPGTEGGEAPFWSPDGESIGFIADRVVKCVSLSGDRRVRTASTVPAQYGATWLADGTIVFSGPDGLYRVPVAGGDAVRLTSLDLARGEYSHRWPVAVPRRRSRFAYLVRSTREDVRGVYLSSLEDLAVRSRLVPDDANVAFGAGADGRVRLFFVHAATLLAQPVDLGAAQLTGEAVEVARPVFPGETGRLAPFAVAGNTVVYRRGAASLNRMVLLNRRGKRLSVLSDATAEHRYPSVSPGGTSVAVAILDGRTGRPDVWVLDLHRRTRERITSDPFGALFPIWMPDGDTIVYASGESGVFDLHARSTRATTGATALFRAPTPTVKYPTSLTPDGRYVLFQSGKQQIYRVSLPSNGEMSLLLSGIQGRVSPDGRWLAYTDTEHSVRQVYVTTFPEATERWRISTGSGEDPQWRGDGKELFYIEGGHTLMAVPIRPASGFQSGPAQALFRAAFPTRVMAWGPSYAPTPDGQQFVVLEADADQEMLLRVTTNWAPGARSGS